MTKNQNNFFCQVLTVALSLWLPSAWAMPISSNVPGGIALLLVGTAPEPAPQVWFQGKRVLVARETSGWRAVVGIPLETEAGRYQVRIQGRGGERMADFEVRPKTYPAQRLTIKNRRMVTPDPEDEERIAQEQGIIGRAKSHWRDAGSVDIDLATPARGPFTSPFGLRRFFNGQARNPHSGLDIAVPRGAPVSSSAAGNVLLTGNFFFNGKTVFVDHGQGLITMYCHLDAIDVREGESVRRGQPLGLSGMTGRATGPHLHWSVMLNGAMVDPKLFVAGAP